MIHISDSPPRWPGMEALTACGMLTKKLCQQPQERWPLQGKQGGKVGYSGTFPVTG